MPPSYNYADLSILRDNGWSFYLAHSGAYGYWKDPETGQEHFTGIALKIQKQRQEGRTGK